MQIDSLHSSSLRQQTQGPPCIRLRTEKEKERRVCVSVGLYSPLWLPQIMLNINRSSVLQHDQMYDFQQSK